MSLGARSILEKRSTATRGAFIFVFSPVIIVMIRDYETPPLIIIMTRGKERQVAPTDFPGKKAHPQTREVPFPYSVVLLSWGFTYSYMQVPSL